MSVAELTGSISNIKIGDAQRKLENTPSDLIPVPQASGAYVVDESVKKALPAPCTKVLNTFNYGESLWGKTAKIVAQLPTGETVNYFLKITLGDTGRRMCEGEFESLKAIDAVSPGFVQKPYAWGKYEKTDQTNQETYFLLAEFRDVGQQPADPVRLGARLADMHQRSISPTGKFGFHYSTCHAKISQAVDSWEDSWCVLYSKHLSHVMELAKPILKWPQFDVVCKLTLEKVVPRLLLPLQADGRVLKPSLIHGDCWDGNTAMDMKTGDAFVFDVCSFYGHNEYDTGNWRAPRHRLSNLAYIKNYKKHFPVSEPEEDWDARNLLYSLTFNIGNTIYIPGSSQKPVVYEDMTTLCQMFCLEDLEREMSLLDKASSTNHSTNPGAGRESKADERYEEEGGEEEEEEEVEEDD